MEIRKLLPEDIKKFFDLVKYLDKETNNRAFEPGERDDNYNLFEQSVINKLAVGSIILFAVENNDLIGYIEGERGSFRRNFHVIHFNIAIKLEFTGFGIGKKLIEEFEKECKNNLIERIEMTVFCDNTNAVKLYKKMGYTIEGTKINSFKINGVSKNEFLMSKSLIIC